MFPPDLGQFSWHLPQNLKKLSGGSAGGVDLLDGHLMWLELRAAKVATSDRWVCANALATGETFSEALGCFVLSQSSCLACLIFSSARSLTFHQSSSARFDQGNPKVRPEHRFGWLMVKVSCDA